MFVSFVWEEGLWAPFELMFGCDSRLFCGEEAALLNAVSLLWVLSFVAMHDGKRDPIDYSYLKGNSKR